MSFTSLKKIAVLLLLVGAAAAQIVNIDTNVKGSRWPAFGTDSGSANAYVVTTVAVLGPSLRTGSKFIFFATHDNTGASTLNVEGTGAKPIKKTVSVALAAGDILAGGLVEVVYDGTNYQMVSGASGGSGIKVNTSVIAGTNANFSDATPAASSNLVNVQWQKDSTTPDTNISAQVPAATTSTLGVIKSAVCSNQFIRSITTGTGTINCATVDVATDVTGVLPTANGGNGTATPVLTQGSNVTITGTWPNYTINATNSGGGSGITGNVPQLAKFVCESLDFSGTSHTSWNCASRSGSNLASGEVVYVFCAYLNSSLTPTFNVPTDSLSNTYAQQIYYASNANSQQFHLQVSSTTSGSAGADTITCNPTATEPYHFMFVITCRSCSATVDTSAGNNGTNGIPNTLLTTTTDYDLGVLFVGGNGDGTGHIGLGMTKLVDPNINANGVYLGMRTFGTAGDYNLSAHMQNSPGDWVAIGIAIK